jgi:hypothetical protein
MDAAAHGRVDKRVVDARADGNHVGVIVVDLGWFETFESRGDEFAHWRGGAALKLFGFFGEGAAQAIAPATRQQYGRANAEHGRRPGQQITHRGQQLQASQFGVCRYDAA